jgi:ATP-dependent DNA ligase
LPPRTLAGRRRDQLTKAPDYGAVLVATTVAQFYLSPHVAAYPPGRVHRAVPSDKNHNTAFRAAIGCTLKHDGFRIIARKTGAQVRLYSRPGE